MISKVRRLAGIAMLLLTTLGHANDATMPAKSRAIPFKSDSVSLEDQGIRTLIVLALLLGITVGGLVYLRHRMPGVAGHAVGRGRLRVVERIKLNQACSLYLISLDQREILFVQCGDSVTQMDAGGNCGPLLPLAEGGRV